MKNTFLVFLMLICFLKSYPQVNLNNGLVAYYPFNGNANDASGNGNNAIFNNATLTSDRFGNPNSAYSFNGVNNFIQIPNSVSLNTGSQISLCAYVRVNGFYEGPCHGNDIINKGQYQGNSNFYFMRFDDNSYTNGLNCSNPLVDTIHQNFYSNDAMVPSPGYSPYINKDQWYCLVYTYDGATTKLYIGGTLITQSSVPGLIASNNDDLYLGRLFYPPNPSLFPYWFNGDLDEVRIYNRAINEQEVEALCLATTNDSLIINDYTAVLGSNICDNTLQVADATKYNAGDTVLLIQMKGAVIDSSNTANFGNTTNYNNAGNYEINIVKQKNGNSISLLNVLQRQYDIPNGKVQLIRVPYYQNFIIDSTLTCLPWDGNKGGVLVLNVANTTTMNANIDVTGKGFHGGNSPNPNTTTLYCNYNDFYYPSGTAGAADKGESNTSIGNQVAWGKGSPANGGGGGNGHNAGGGGGSNGGAGGFGGYQLDACGGAATDNRGVGGKALVYSNASNKIFMGGGGGSGHTDNAGGSPMNGGNGGGIIIIRSPIINSNGFSVNARGGDAPQCNLTPIDLCHDGSGGGGGAGTMLIENTTFSNSTNLDVRGGKGGDLVIYNPPSASRIGPGGGGGAGVVWFNNAAVPPNIVLNNNGGINGVIILDNNNPYGTSPGQPGINLFNLKIPSDTTLFKPNIDSVRFSDSATSCSSYDFRGMVYTNTINISSWNWSFGDGSTGNQQNTSHTYNAPGNYPVKLVVSDIHGCMDSISTSVNISSINITKSNDTSLCGSRPVQLFAGGGISYSWTPSATLNNPNIANPVATPLSNTVYYVTVSTTFGCSRTDSVKITVNNIPVITKSNDTTVCQNTSLQLFAGGGSNYSWTPASSLNNPNIQNPIATPEVPTTYYVIVTNASGCSSIDSIQVNLNPVPVITKLNDTAICNQTSVQLFVTGGVAYLWSPAATLDNSASATPVASPLTTTTYKVKITDNFSCNYFDSVKISILPAPVFTISPDGSVCSGASLQLTASGGDSYMWEPANGLNDPGISNPAASPEATTTYTVTIHENTCNQTGILSTTVQVFALPDVKASSSNDLTCSEGSSQLHATGAFTYTWSPATGLDKSKIQDPIATPGNTTLYTVTGVDINGCINNDTVTVKTDFNMNALYLMANSFTPNGDGKNDCFGIKDWGIIQDLDFSIYNRFGERVFHTSDAGTCWDGTYHQLMEDADVYVYVIKAKTACGNIEKKGTVMLIR